MSLHLLSAISTLYATPDAIDLVKMQRAGYILGYYTLSDLLVGDNWSTEYPPTSYDRLYLKHVKWNTVYVPCINEHKVIYALCREWFCRGPVPPLVHSTQLDDVTMRTATHYTRACVGMCGALRSLLACSTVEVGQLCEDILLFIGGILKEEIQDIPEDVIEKNMALRRAVAQKKLNKIN